MQTTRRIFQPGLILALLVMDSGFAEAQAPKPLSEEALLQRIKAGLDEDEIIGQVEKKGIAFAATESTLKRLEKAGASPAMLSFIQKASKTTTADNAVTYAAVLKMLLTDKSEAEILQSLEQSPTTFTLSAAQLHELTQAGVSPKVLAAMQQPRTPVAEAGSDVTALAIILDCSGSMKELTKEKEPKMEAAERAVIELIGGLADGLDVTFIVYGSGSRPDCQDVHVVRELGPMNQVERERLQEFVAALKPKGRTPIALSLRTAGVELMKNQGQLTQVVLITDGMETCQGNPAAEAERLFNSLKLRSVDVIGFGVSVTERSKLEQIAKAGHGSYIEAKSAAEVVKGVKEVAGAKIQTPAITSHKSAVSGILVEPITLKGFPPIAEVIVYKAGSHLAASANIVQKSANLAQPLLLPPGVYDLTYSVPELINGKRVGHNRVWLTKNVEVKAGQMLKIKSDALVSFVLVRNPNVPGLTIEGVTVYEEGGHASAYIVQRGEVDVMMPVHANGSFDIYLNVTGQRPVNIAKGVAAKSGELTVVGDGQQREPAGRVKQ